MSSFPTDIQRDSMQCGTTCLQMICEFYGKNYSSDPARCIYGISKPSEKRVAEIKETLHRFGKELLSA